MNKFFELLALVLICAALFTGMAGVAAAAYSAGQIFSACVMAALALFSVPAFYFALTA